MPDAIYNDSQRRHDFVLLFDVMDGNPNGDPDAGNLPRVDPETMHGLVTDVCLKRKVRNYVDATRGKDARYKIFVENRGYLADHKKRAYEAVGAKKGDDSKLEEARAWMCSNYYDVRTFGAVLVGKKAEGYNCGQVRGPLQLTFGRSIDPGRSPRSVHHARCFGKSRRQTRQWRRRGSPNRDHGPEGFGSLWPLPFAWFLQSVFRSRYEV